MNLTLKKSNLRIVLVAALAIVMSLAFATSAFATAPGDYSTVVYKTGTTQLSMANDAVTGADYNEDILTVYVQPITVQMGPTAKTGYATGLELDGQDGIPEDVNNDGIVDKFTFDLEDASGTTELSAVFIIALDDGTGHPGTNGNPASADFVVYLP